MKAPEASLGSFLICVHVRGQQSNASAPVIVNLQDNEKDWRQVRKRELWRNRFS